MRIDPIWRNIVIWLVIAVLLAGLYQITSPHERTYKREGYSTRFIRY